MPECPECGGELVHSTAHTESRGSHKVFECEHCDTTYEVDEIAD